MIFTGRYAYRPLLANSGCSPQTKKATKKPPSDNQYQIKIYTFLRLAMPINPIKPVLNNHAAAGKGTALMLLIDTN